LCQLTYKQITKREEMSSIMSVRGIHPQQQPQQQSQTRQATMDINDSEPIVRYTYYDTDGTRIKQSFDSITSTTITMGPTQANNNNQQQFSPPVSPPVMMHRARRYENSSYVNRCLRCGCTVYQMDKVGPLKDFTFYHQGCFKCAICGTKLTLKTYFNNQSNHSDQEVYCQSHCPKTGPGRLDGSAVGIRAALNAPKVGPPVAPIFTHSVHYPMFSYHTNLPNNYPASNNDDNVPQITTSDVRRRLEAALAEVTPQNSGQNIQTGSELSVKKDKGPYATLSHTPGGLSGLFRASNIDKKINEFLDKRLAYLEPRQKRLEMRHRQEEDALYREFETKLQQEEQAIKRQIKHEWDKEVARIINSAKLSRLTAQANSRNEEISKLEYQNQEPEARARLIQQQQQQPESLVDLEKSMTLKLNRKKETLKRKLKELERQATSDLIEKQSKEMLALISAKLDEYREEKRLAGDDSAEELERIERLANRLSSLALECCDDETTNDQDRERQHRNSTATSAPGGGAAAASTDGSNRLVAAKCASKCANTTGQHLSNPSNGNGNRSDNKQVSALGTAPLVTAHPPPPMPALVSKLELYSEPELVFRDIDATAINVAKCDQQTFTDLVHHLTRNCLTDVDKLRAIYRWITVKNLNTMQFEDDVKPDTPLGILRGIKNGSESYHVLLKRLCSYAGLHCVVIKGYSKSAGYQPGFKFDDNRFRNSWNAVYVAGAWRFIQCNWGARHLVSVATVRDRGQLVNHESGSPSTKEKRPSKKQQVSATNGSSPISGSSTSAGSSPCSPLLLPTPMAKMALPDQRNHHKMKVVNQSTTTNQTSSRRPTGSAASSTSPSSSSSSASSSLSSMCSSSSCCSPASIVTSNDHLPQRDSIGSTPDHHQHHHRHKSHHHHHHKHRSAVHNHLHDVGNSNHKRDDLKDIPATKLSLLTSSISPTSPNCVRVDSSNLSSSSSLLSSTANPAAEISSTVATNDIANHRKSNNGQNNNISNSNKDSLRYEYDDHYFLTDPDEFIYEFFPLQPEWQLIKRPISLHEFEQLPFVRSLFFRYGLYFPQEDIRSVLYADSSGATTIKIGMPTHMIPSLIFHYNLKFYNRDVEHYDGISLKRFVMQSVESGF
ncbi:Hillarin, partial [Fragariocoptes setiger]